MIVERTVFDAVKFAVNAVLAPGGDAERDEFCSDVAEKAANFGCLLMLQGQDGRPSVIGGRFRPKDDDPDVVLTYMREAEAVTKPLGVNLETYCTIAEQITLRLHAVGYRRVV